MDSPLFNKLRDELMQRTPEEYITLYVFVVIFLLLSFLFLFKKPVKSLHLMGTERKSNEIYRGELKPSPQAHKAQAKGMATSVKADNSERKNSSSNNEKTLNVFFIYNDHSWDAYEVLGLPAGSPFDLVQQSYEKMIADSPDTIEFIEAAYQAIKLKLKI